MRTPADDWKAWNQSCFDCAITRGWTKEELLSRPYPFHCVHRETLEGKQQICAVWKRKLENFKGFQP